MRADLVARTDELSLAAAVLDSVGDGPAALVVEGETGIGKTTVLRAIAATARERGFIVLTSRPAEPEVDLPFGALADLLRDVDDELLGGLPTPQRRALDAALLRSEPDQGDPDPRAVPAATLSVLRALAQRAPVLVGLDDAQWLDSASAAALGYAARRLGRSPVGFLIGVRTPGAGSVLDLVPALPDGRVTRVRLAPLSLGALHHVVEGRLGVTLPRGVLARIAEAAAGNPFHALEIARALQERDDADTSVALPVPAAIRDLTRERVRTLPVRSRAALLRVAAMSRPTTAFVDCADLELAEAAGIVEIRLDGRITFAHPLFAAAVYGDAPPTERREVHRDLAQQIPDADERARHAALAATGPDAGVAQLLTESAARARARGATAIAAELVQLALWLTPPGSVDDRFRREARLAQYLSLAGDPAHAEHLLRTALRTAPPGDARDEALITLAMICRETDHARAIEACEQALDGATNPALVARAHAILGLLLETVDVGRAAEHSAAAASRFEQIGDRAGWSYAVLGQCWHQLVAGQPPDEATFEHAVAVQQELWSVARWRSCVPAAWALAHDEFDLARSRYVVALERARSEGHEADHALLQAIVAQIDAWRGAPDRADAEADVALELARLCGSSTTLADVLRIRANIDALLGRHDRARDVLGPELTLASRPDDGRFVYANASVLAFLAWSNGDAAEADAQFRRARESLDRVGVHENPGYRYVGDHVEAVLALGDVDRAEAITAELEARAAVFPRPWTLAVAARCRAIVVAARGDLDAALDALDLAVERHAALQSPYELGRTLLAKGHVHRRRTEKRLARDAFEAAAQLFEAAGAVTWTQRAQAEAARIRFRAAPTELTETELLIAQLAAAGRTNREIAGTVYVSPKTVETRLSSVYGKLGIRSRAELGAWMAARMSQGVAAAG